MRTCSLSGDRVGPNHEENQLRVPRLPRAGGTCSLHSLQGKRGQASPPSSAGIKGRGAAGLRGLCVRQAHAYTCWAVRRMGSASFQGGLTVHGSPVLCANTAESSATNGSFLKSLPYTTIVAYFPFSCHSSKTDTKRTKNLYLLRTHRHTSRRPDRQGMASDVGGGLAFYSHS